MDTIDRVLDRVRKLLALGGSPNQAEAEAAVEKAHNLLKAHNLSMTDLEQKEALTEETFMEGTMIRNWRKILLHAVAEYNFCGLYAHVFRDTSGPRATTKTHLKVVGTEAGVIVTRIMATYLMDVVTRLARDFQKDGDTTATLEGFKFGVAETLVARLRHLRDTEAEESPESHALVVRGLDAVENFFRQQNMEQKTIDPAEDKRDDMWAWMAGRVAGNKVNLSPQLADSASEHLAIEENHETR